MKVMCAFQWNVLIELCDSNEFVWSFSFGSKLDLCVR